MRPDDLVSWLKVEPFRPFRLHLVSGRSYDIRHRKMMRVGRTTAHVYFYEGQPDPFEKMEMIGLVLIERIEPIDGSPAATSGNPSRSS